MKCVHRNGWEEYMERTYVMLKPDALSRKLAGKIIARMEEKGFEIVALKIMMLQEETLRQHYAHVADKPFFPDLLEYMTSGPVWCMAVEGENAIMGMRILSGATKYEEARAGTIRGDYGTSTTRNIIHASDSVESAALELKRFFGD